MRQKLIHSSTNIISEINGLWDPCERESQAGFEVLGRGAGVEVMFLLRVWKAHQRIEGSRFGQSHGPCGSECLFGKFLEAQGHCDTGLVSCSSRSPCCLESIIDGVQGVAMPLRPHFPHPGPLLLPSFFYIILHAKKNVTSCPAEGHACWSQWHGPSEDLGPDQLLELYVARMGLMGQGPRCWT